MHIHPLLLRAITEIILTTPDSRTSHMKFRTEISQISSNVCRRPDFLFNRETTEIFQEKDRMVTYGTLISELIRFRLVDSC